jgi:hypothetical protein
VKFTLEQATKVQRGRKCIDMYKTTLPEDNTDSDVRRNKNFAAELTEAAKL